MCLRPIFRNTAEKPHLGVSRIFCETPRNGSRLCQRRIPAQVKLPWMPDFSTRDKVRFFKIYEPDREDGAVQCFRVGSSNRLSDVRNRLSFHVQIAHAEQSDEAIWLDGDHLIKLWSQSEIQL